jgi:hypothetical protein
VSSDATGYLFGRRGADDLWIGSHLGTVPNGRRFDRALGIVAGIEVADRLPDAPLAVVGFRAEETGPIGSPALTVLPRGYLELHIEQGPVPHRLGASRWGSSPRSSAAELEAKVEGQVVHELPGGGVHVGERPLDREHRIRSGSGGRRSLRAAPPRSQGPRDPRALPQDDA